MSIELCPHTIDLIAEKVAKAIKRQSTQAPAHLSSSFRAAEECLRGQTWSIEQANYLKQLIDIGTTSK